jgi:hypothetical protein
MNNDLRGAFERADTVNAQAIKFYLMLMYNVGCLMINRVIMMKTIAANMITTLAR